MIFTPHWGVEYVHAARPEQEGLARAAIEAGAVAVIGNHPHVLQPWERHVAADGREGFIAYSLGNFVSGQHELPRRTSVILVLGLAQDAAGDLVVSGARYVPLAMTNNAGLGRSPAHGVDATDRVGATAHAAHAASILPVGAALPATAQLTGGSACDGHRRLTAVDDPG